MIPRNRLETHSLFVTSTPASKPTISEWTIEDLYGGSVPSLFKPNISAKGIAIHGYEGAVDEKLLIYPKKYLKTV